MSIELKFLTEQFSILSYIKLVHQADYIEKIFSKIPTEGLVSVKKEPYADTFLCSNSKNAILRSCGSGLIASDKIIANKENNERAELFAELLSDLKEMNHLKKIEFLESKVAKNLDEASYSELMKLKTQLNRD